MPKNYVSVVNPKPTDPVYPSGAEACFEGMNHRTWIAAQIMAGFAGNSSLSTKTTPGLIAKESVQWTDALIAELNKKQLSRTEEPSDERDVRG